MSKITSLEVGQPALDNYEFTLTHPISKDNILTFSYGKHNLFKLANNIYSIPVLVNAHANILMIFSPKVYVKEWNASYFCSSFAPARISKGVHEVTDLDTKDAVSTGRGLNIIGSYSPKAANKMVRYFKVLEQINAGYWQKIVSES